MPRTKSILTVQEAPKVKGMTVQNLPIIGENGVKKYTRKKDPIQLNVEEWEVIRLMNYEGFIQEEVAQIMGTSRPTITRTCKEARKKLAAALVEGRNLVIEGGRYKLK